MQADYRIPRFVSSIMLIVDLLTIVLGAWFHTGNSILINVLLTAYCAIVLLVSYLIPTNFMGRYIIFDFCAVMTANILIGIVYENYYVMLIADIFYYVKNIFFREKKVVVAKVITDLIIFIGAYFINWNSNMIRMDAVITFMACVALVLLGSMVCWIIDYIVSMLEEADEQEVSMDDMLTLVDSKVKEAENANKAKSNFLANMSHEIRTPINAVLGMDTMILRKSKDSEIRRYANDIQSAGRSLLSIINDILDFSKIEAGKMELVPVDYDFASLINDVYNMISAKARDKDLEFVLEIDETIPYKLYGDDVRIRQVLVNLLTNAVKYTPLGTVTLIISRVQNDSDTDCLLHFEVKDTGIGIKLEDISKLTEEFVRIEESRNRNIEGTGLGINIVVSLLSLMGSKLEVDSVYGEGSTFYFDLLQPIMDKEEIGDISKRLNSDFSEDDEYLASFCIPDARLLVVDDNPMNLSVFSSLLSDMRCQIDEADSGAKCLELVKENKYDIIFMDHMMPEMDGIVTFHYMKEFGDYINAKTPVVILTANAISGAKEIYLNEGFTDYLSKPIDVDKLEAMIEKLIPDEKKQPAEKKERPSEVSIDIDLPFIDGVDWKHAILKLKTEALLMDSIKNFSSMAQMDIKILIGMYEKVIDTNEQSTFDEYRIKVHSMKSNVATIGADHVAGLAKYLEYAAKDYNLATIQNLMPLFESEWNKLKEEIDEVFGYNRASNKAEGDGKAIDISELKMMIDLLKEAMEETDLDRADAIVEELSAYTYPKDQMDLLEEIKMAVLNIDEDLLVKVIEQWNILIK